ncbi:hypothetical protein BDP81DRAFT_393966 [Colletotrichum phormii]|uniref:Uncharacterized protein n=1 Tax=Colletotrichum phormii TaxID=359342 RepID=A0AAI9ZUM8_9PEZI|nr:uncharacterized protein BDP81DRAFT_393966 [Colletotrichum phormii]KAK1637293.1 hypothetical protein BDP81DRAFT_393966 [Colletotrichum phormii]
MGNLVISPVISTVLLLGGAGLVVGLHDKFSASRAATTSTTQSIAAPGIDLITLTGTGSRATYLRSLLPQGTLVVSPIKANVRVDSISAISAIPTTTINCDHKWCQDGTSLCAYWAGITGWDPTEGPVPGETVTSVGECSVVPSQVGNQKRDTMNEMLITSVPTPSVDCKYKYCDRNTQYCMYWAGVTGWDPSLGPIPGMTRTSLGACQAPPTAAVNGTTVPTTMVTKTCTSCN